MNEVNYICRVNDIANELQTWLLLFTSNMYVTLYYSVAKPYTVVRLRTTVEMINCY